MSMLLRRRGIVAQGAGVPSDPGVTGAGTSGDPYVFTTGASLSLLQDEPDAFFELANDIAAPAGTWTGVEFDGSFDGRGYTLDLSDLTISVGLFENMFGTLKRTGFFGGQVSSPSGQDAYKGSIFQRLNTGSLVEDCWTEGCTVITGGDRAGGFLGITAAGTLRRCWSASLRSGAVGLRTGGFGGFDNGGTLSNLFFDSDVWGSTAAGGGGGVGVARTTSQMQQEATFSGFDFDNVWQIDEGNDYPRLQPDPV